MELFLDARASAGAAPRSACGPWRVLQFSDKAKAIEITRTAHVGSDRVSNRISEILSIRDTAPPADIAWSSK